MRTLLAALCAATLLATPATAGPGVSTDCQAQGELVLTNPVTIGVDVAVSGDNTKIWICFSDAPPGSGAFLSGKLLIDVWRNTGSSPGLYVGVWCWRDGHPISCYTAGASASVNVARDDVRPAAGCALYGGSTCLVPVPFGTILLNGDAGTPLVAIHVGDKAVVLDSPVRCLGTAPC